MGAIDAADEIVSFSKTPQKRGHAAFGAKFMQVEMHITVDEVEASGVSANTRVSISATATTDDTAAMNTLVRCVEATLAELLYYWQIGAVRSIADAHDCASMAGNAHLVLY